jgi:hypothetical protein
VRFLSRLFRRLFLEKLAAAHDAGRLRFFGNHARLIEPSDADEPPMQSLPCPCCGDRTIVIETFERGSTPRMAGVREASGEETAGRLRSVVPRAIGIVTVACGSSGRPPLHRPPPHIRHFLGFAARVWRCSDLLLSFQIEVGLVSKKNSSMVAISASVSRTIPQLIDFTGVPDGIRTRVTAVKER